MGHVPHAASYAVKAVSYDAASAAEERAWQYQHLLKLVDYIAV